jgi:uncharacterized protein YkwD
VTRKSRLNFEALEIRDCPATVNLFNGVLTVVGTAGNDNITVYRSGGYIVAGGQMFNSASVGELVISGGAGNDVIHDETGLGAVIYGGMGNDIICGARGADVIYGGQGNDTISGGRGADRLIGGGGSNTIDGGLGVNSIIPGSPTATRANSAIETQIIQLVNAYRMSNGLASLAVNGQLNVAAELHSADMAAIGSVYGPTVGMQHELFGTLHPEVTDRLDAAGYDTWTTSFAWGENIAYGYSTAADVVNAWINSPEHRANILDGTFTETGVSVQAAANGTLFFTQDFGHQS